MKVEYAVLKTWSGGFTAEFSITNTSNESLIDWELIFDFAAQIEGAWRGEIAGQDGNTYRLIGKSYNDTLAPGETITVGVKVSGDSSVEPVFHLADDATEDPILEPAPATTTEAPTGEDATSRGSTEEPTAPALSGDSRAVIDVPLGSSASDLQSLIDRAPAGSVLRLAEGTYTFDRTVTLDRDDITVEGLGSDRTRIVTDFPSGNEGPAFHIVGDGLSGGYSLAADVREGAASLDLAGSHDFAAGDFVWIERPNTEEFFTAIGDTSWLKDKPLRTSIARVEDVDGGTLLLENGVHFDFSAGDATVRKLEMAENVTLRGIAIESSLGESDAADLSNTLSAYYRVATVDLDGTYRATLDDVAVIESGSTAFQFKKTLAMTADQLYADGAHNKGAGGNGYAYELKDVYESALTNLEDHDMRHSLLFASWYSAVNNTAEINYTDRDVNFHGGRDHGNVVTVHVSERDPAADNMSSALSYNSEGEHYGAPTDPDANSVSFDRMLGSKRSDVVQGSDIGAHLDGRGQDDVLSGGLGDDTLIGGADEDLLIGNGGADIARFSGAAGDYTISQLSDASLRVDGADGTDTVRSVEWLEFADGTRISTADYLAGGSTDGETIDKGGSDALEGGVSSRPVILAGTDGNDSFFVDDPAIVIDAGGGWDRVESTVSYTVAPESEMLTILGEDAIDATGNEARNVLRGNEAGNRLKGEGGDDDFWARGGVDRLYGGAGADKLYGQAGDDSLMGGGGSDTLEGGSGADSFRFDRTLESDPAGRDIITDFNAAEGDVIDLTRFDADVGSGGRQSINYLGARAFSGTAGELRYADGVLAGDVDGDGEADVEVEVAGVTGFEPEDFLV